MSGNDSMRFRPSALFPLTLSVLSFSLTLVLVLSGTNPTSESNGYLFSLNTTNVGTRLIELSPIVPVTAAVNTARNDRSYSARTIIADPVAQNSTTSNSSLSETPNTSVTIAATSSAPANSTTSAVPTLAIPQTAGPTDPAVIPITLVGTVFQLILNTLASSMPQSFQNIIQLAVTTQKQSLGVSQIYTFHVRGICFGSGANATVNNATSESTVTRCVSYADTGSYFENSTKNVSDFTLVASTNITVPALSKIPALGKSGKSFMDKLGAVILGVFLISLIGNGFSIILSIAAFAFPSYGKIPAAGAGITILSSQMLQISAFTSTFLANGLSSGINGSTDISGLSATTGGKFLAFIWVAFIAAQITNGYWFNLWFVKYRTTAFKKRERTQQQMQAGYRAIGKEVLSDFRLKKPEHDDTEGLVNGSVEIKSWNESYNKI